MGIAGRGIAFEGRHCPELRSQGQVRSPSQICPCIYTSTQGMEQKCWWLHSDAVAVVMEVLVLVMSVVVVRVWC